MDSGSSAACSESRAVCIWIMGLGLLVENLGLTVYIWILGLAPPVVNLGPSVCGFWV